MTDPTPEISQEAARAKHTPGPWRASQPDGVEHAHVSDVGGYAEGDICTTWSAAGDAFANALLIAAAPDMLAALEELLALHIAHHNNPAHVRARAAIALASGRAS